MFNRLRTVLAILAGVSLLACALPGRCADATAVVVPLAEGGQARAVIVIPNAANESTKWAASELQRDLRSLSGAEVLSLPKTSSSTY